MRFDILTIFPEALRDLLSTGILGQAQASGVIDVRLHDLRSFTDDPHRIVDDRPYGGGAGMLMKVEPFVTGIESIKASGDGKRRTVLLSPQGRLFRQADAADWARLDGLILLCGRYEGVDERIIEFVDEEISIGDYVLAGGEVAAAVVVEATARMMPGVVGKFDSIESDSFYDKPRLGAPQYTRPPEFRGLRVPEVLLSGDHAKIEAFREAQAWKKTTRNRPELLGLSLEETTKHG
ncbi:tRNA (guanosine(37)-N1)-methyltransferase TrmD [Candidatus Bipolaricaulota bacterium]|jgi:tRNA (guanine37-N1)-methyltransferase|nr:tRNA (guanosine(37)-N1)-methyltransferase TrmD [Candidatus Bipolaricaulota bacterium]TFH07664.1 MAG: tRNA (guanosine(37)-N1)-methyltransferase TrmD [Candidatus Atribacteria bacterium]